MGLLPDSSTLRRDVKQARLRDGKKELVQHPQDYSSRATLVLPQPLRELDGKCFVLHDSGPATGDERFIIFGTEETVSFLKKSPIWFADGTFKMCPNLFEQVYTVHGGHDGFVFPCIFALLPNKTKMTYRRSVPQLLLILCIS